MADDTHGENRDILKKTMSELKLESGKSVGSSSVAANTLGKEMSFDEKMSMVTLSLQQLEVGGSSTTQDDYDDVTYASLLSLIGCIRDVNREIITRRSEEKAMAVELWKDEDKEFLKKKLREWNHEFGVSIGSSSMADNAIITSEPVGARRHDEDSDDGDLAAQWSLGG